MYLFITHHSPKPVRQQSGAALITILFIIVVLGFLGLSANLNQQKSSAQLVSAVLGTRADMAARSAMQMDISDYYMKSSGSCRSSAKTFNFSGPGFSQCSATVSCQAIGQLDSKSGSDNVKVFKLTSTGQCNTGSMQYQRVIETGIRG